MTEKLELGKLPNVPRPNELLAISFNRASEAAEGMQIKGKPVYVARERETRRIKVASQTLKGALKRLVAKTPSFTNLHPFYKELIGAMINVDEVRRALGAINRTVAVIEKIEREHLRMLRNVDSAKEASSIRRQAYGRFSSAVKRTEGNLRLLKEAVKKLSKIPSVFIDMPTLVIAGYPNVGKTMLLKRLTGSEPKIAPYPFTTRGLNLGYFERNHKRYQVIDTPGLLDRPLEKRNPIERQTITALRRLADVVIFMLDPSGTCGYGFEEQLSLLEEIRRTFPELKVLTVVNKADLLDEKMIKAVGERCKDAIFISAATGQGVSTLEEIVEEAIKVSFANM